MTGDRKTALLYFSAGLAFLLGAFLAYPHRWFGFVPGSLFVLLGILQLRRARLTRK